jgi:hypothetical protein
VKDTILHLPGKPLATSAYRSLEISYALSSKVIIISAQCKVSPHISAGTILSAMMNRMLTLWGLCILTCDKLSSPFHFAIFVVLIAVTVKIIESSICWSIMPCSLLSVSQHFRGACCLLLSHWFLACLFLQPRRWRRHAYLKCLLTSNGLHSIVSQKIELFMTTAVGTSNPA